MSSKAENKKKSDKAKIRLANAILKLARANGTVPKNFDIIENDENSIALVKKGQECLEDNEIIISVGEGY